MSTASSTRYYGPPERVGSAELADARRLVDDASGLAADLANDTAIDGNANGGCGAKSSAARR